MTIGSVGRQPIDMNELKCLQAIEEAYKAEETTGAGFIGRSVLPRLVESGYLSDSSDRAGYGELYSSLSRLMEGSRDKKLRDRIVQALTHVRRDWIREDKSNRSIPDSGDASEELSEPPSPIARPLGQVDEKETVNSLYDKGKNPRSFRVISTDDIKVVRRPDQVPAIEESELAVEENSRQALGGKGFYLHKMKGEGLLVPPFVAIEAHLLSAIDELRIEPDIVRKHFPAFHIAEPITLLALKTRVNRLPRLKGLRDQRLSELSDFIASGDFFSKVSTLPVASMIRRRYEQLKQSSPDSAFIVRSSGISEDGFGDAQAGRYESHVHGEDDILKTCLKVIASGFQPKACATETGAPMALLIQACIDCRFGGVVISHTSLSDDTMRVEYVPGQPKGGVSGQSGVTPHCYTIERKNGKPLWQWTKGNVPTRFVLSQSEGGQGFTEAIIQDSDSASDVVMLSEHLLTQLYDDIKRLENRLGCPVDVEFAISKKGVLYLVQVRPVTRLSGGTQFTGTVPEAPLVCGEPISEGCCCGPSMMVEDEVEPEALPKGVILHAHHADDWMLKPAVLNRVGGFVFKAGGVNDHVAISLRQAGKACLLTGEYEHKPQQPGAEETLIVGTINDTPSAFLVSGDLVEEWESRRSDLTGNYRFALTALSSYRPAKVSFSQVDEGFQWLNQQNTKLLDYFQPERLLSQCLSKERSKLLCMSADRNRVLAALNDEVTYMVADSRAFLEGYQRFLELAGCVEKEPVATYLRELEPLKAKLDSCEQLLKKSLSIASCITEDKQEWLNNPIDFQQLMDSFSALKNTLQRLNQPASPEQVTTLHDVIFLVHKRFVDALAKVAELSGQGVIEDQNQVKVRSTFVHLPEERAGLLDGKCKEAVNHLAAAVNGEIKTLNLPAACVVNAQLGDHVCTVQMFEKGEGGKGRKLRLVFSDNLRSPLFRAGKLKRMFFLERLLRNTLAGNQSGGVDTKFNEVAGQMQLEWIHIKSTEAMRKDFTTALSILSRLNVLDMRFDEVNLTGTLSGKVATFAELKTLINTNVQNEDNLSDWALKRCLLLASKFGKDIKSELLNDVYKVFNDAYDTPFLSGLKLKTAEPVSSEVFQLFLNQRTRHLPSETAKAVQQDLAIQLLLLYPDQLAAAVMAHHLGALDVDRAVWLCRQNSKLFYKLPTVFQNTRSVVLSALDGNGELLDHPDFKKYQKDKEAVLHAVCDSGMSLRFADRALQADKEVVLAAVRQSGEALEYASDALKEDTQVVWAAVSQNGLSLEYAGASFKQDIALASVAIQGNPYAIRSVSAAAISEESYFQLAMEAVQSHGRAFEGVDSDLLSYEHYLCTDKSGGKASRIYYSVSSRL